MRYLDFPFTPTPASGVTGEQTNWLTRTGAMRLAEEISAYWRDLGYNVPPPPVVRITGVTGHEGQRRALFALSFEGWVNGCPPAIVAGERPVRTPAPEFVRSGRGTAPETGDEM